MGFDTVRGKGLNEATPARPPIWAEGRQRPKFDLMAWVSVATSLAKQALVPATDDAATRLQALAHRVSSGQLRVSGRWAKRILPSHQAVGGGLMWLSQEFLATNALIRPPYKPNDALAYPSLAVKPVVSLPPAPDKLEPTLHAILSAIGSPAHDFAQEWCSAYQPTAPTTDKVRFVNSITTRALLGVLMLFAWPGGAVKALLVHLDGGDLRDWS